MAIDRDSTLRKAEKLLRQGRLDAAISEYARVVTDFPSDWKTVNILGDLYVRAGQVESAVTQYARIAEHLAREGFLSKAAAVYKKIVKIKPDDEHALLRAAEISEEQGLAADARVALGNLADRRRRRGDQRGAAELALRVARLDPTDLTAGLAGARAALELGDKRAAIDQFKTVGSSLLERGKIDEGRTALIEAARLDPADTETRGTIWRVLLDAGDLEQALEFCTTAEQYRAIAVEMASRGREDEALGALDRVVALEPSDVETRLRLARSYVARGDLERARTYLVTDGVESSAELQQVHAEIELRTGRLESGRALLQSVLAQDPGRREELVLLACHLCETTPDGAFQAVDAATDAAVQDADWPSAASALHEFVTRVPNHIPALMKLVEICVDGGLEATMYSAQAQLADAYLTAERPGEARVIAEDLVAREPWERANIERFRRALTMLGEPDPDAIIAERLSGDSPFLSTDFTQDLEPKPEPSASEDPDAGAGPEELVVLSVEGEEEGTGRIGAPPPGKGTPKEPTPATTGDVLAVVDEANGDGAFEIDLSDMLGEIAQPAGADTTRDAPVKPSDELEAVFDSFREEAGDPAAEHFRLALTYEGMGMIDQSLKQLEIAARSPKYRFDASARIARAERSRGRSRQALEWFERAAEAPAPDLEAGRALLYDLGQTLAGAGETARALAVFMELEADAPGYRDVKTQVGRLRQLSQA